MKNILVPQLVLYPELMAVVLPRLKNVRRRKQAYFLMFALKPLINTMEWSQGRKDTALLLPFSMYKKKDDNLWTGFCMETKSSVQSIRSQY